MKCKKKSLLWSVITSPVVVLCEKEKCKRMEEKEKGLLEVVLFCVRRGKSLEEKVT
jgi:hypothetical protein